MKVVQLELREETEETERAFLAAPGVEDSHGCFAIALVRPSRVDVCGALHRAGTGQEVSVELTSARRHRRTEFVDLREQVTRQVQGDGATARLPWTFLRAAPSASDALPRGGRALTLLDRPSERELGV